MLNISVADETEQCQQELSVPRANISDWRLAAEYRQLGQPPNESGSIPSPFLRACIPVTAQQ